jgi:P4 family phage/plasmid primase-like protien
MKKLPDEVEFELQTQYGTPFLVNKKNVISGVNEQYFAGYFAKSIAILYAPTKKSFYLYDDETGVWKQESDEKIINMIGKLLLWYSRQYTEPTTLSYRKHSTYTSILKLLKGIVENKDAFAKRHGYFYHCADCILKIDSKTGSVTPLEFSPDYFSLYQSAIKYEPNCTCPKFIELLLSNAMTPDDIEHLQLYFGQCILGINISQTFLLLIGTPAGGKSTLVNVIEKINGRWNCAELRTAHMTGRFEVGSVRGKTLLTGKDVDSGFMNGAGAKALKVLTGNDTVTAEYKNSNQRHNIEGNFNIIITSNNTLQINFDGDIDAWRRRILIIRYDNPPPEKKIANFDDVLIEEEGSGILNWALEGAVKLIKSGGIISKSDEQEARVDFLLKSSRPFECFADNFIHPTPGAAVTTEEVVSTFMKFCDKHKWKIPTERKIQQQLCEYMGKRFGARNSHGIKRNGKPKRGYCGFQIRRSKQPS